MLDKGCICSWECDNNNPHLNPKFFEQIINIATICDRWLNKSSFLVLNVNPDIKVTGCLSVYLYQRISLTAQPI